MSAGGEGSSRAREQGAWLAAAQPGPLCLVSVLIYIRPCRLVPHPPRSLVMPGTCPVRCRSFRVLDEVDQMLAMGFIEDVETILKQGENNRDQIQTLLFSATLPKWVQGLTQRFLRPGHKFLDLVGDDRMQVRAGQEREGRGGEREGGEGRRGRGGERLTRRARQGGGVNGRGGEQEEGAGGTGQRRNRCAFGTCTQVLPALTSPGAYPDL